MKKIATALLIWLLFPQNLSAQKCEYPDSLLKQEKILYRKLGEIQYKASRRKIWRHPEKREAYLDSIIYYRDKHIEIIDTLVSIASKTPIYVDSLRLISYFGAYKKTAYININKNVLENTALWKIKGRLFPRFRLFKKNISYLVSLKKFYIEKQKPSQW